VHRVVTVLLTIRSWLCIMCLHLLTTMDEEQEGRVFSCHALDGLQGLMSVDDRDLYSRHKIRHP